MPSRENLLKRTGPSQEKRHWVRLTRACNNHCLFCLDGDCQDGTSLELDHVMKDVERGRRESARRLILSGGEPTIHPGYIQIIRRSVGIGYRWIQTISNGRRFAYPGFTAKAVRAGLNEVTVSMHGHTASLHDALTMVPGSFAQSVAGIKNLLRSGRCHVSVDVVMNSRNITYLTDIIEEFAGLGVREFDLLLIQPFGRAWQHRELMLEKKHAHHIREGITRAGELQCWVWTNRVPPEYLEGMEDMIQEPLKLLDDVRGRMELFQRNIKNATLPDCWGDKCDYCILRNYCSYFFNLLALLGITDSSDSKIKDTTAVPLIINSPLSPSRIEFAKALLNKYFHRKRPSTLKFVIRKTSTEPYVQSAEKISGGSSVILEIHDTHPGKYPFKSNRVKNVIFEPELLDIMTRFHGECAKTVIARKTLQSADLPGSVNKLVYRPYSDIARELDEGPDFKKIERRFRGLSMIDVPPCLSGNRSEWTAWPFISMDWFDDEMQPDPMKFAESFLAELNTSKSLKCASCIYEKSCRGIHINYIRKFGYGALKPV